MLVLVKLGCDSSFGNFQFVSFVSLIIVVLLIVSHIYL